jgi:hypothetical protein
MAPRLAGVRAVLDHLDRREEIGERPHGRRLSGTAISEDEDAAHRRIHGRDQERILELVLADKCRKRIGASARRLEVGSLTRRLLDVAPQLALSKRRGVRDNGVEEPHG